MMIRAVLPASAARSCVESSSIFTIVPGVCAKPATVDCSWRSSTTRSVMTMTLLKIGWSTPNPAAVTVSVSSPCHDGVCNRDR